MQSNMSCLFSNSCFIIDFVTFDHSVSKDCIVYTETVDRTTKYIVERRAQGSGVVVDTH